MRFLQPKQVKKYVYTKQCRPVPKTVCDNSDQMSLVPSCVPSSRKECSFHPEERCENAIKFSKTALRAGNLAIDPP